jgi:hypothetical protein
VRPQLLDAFLRQLVFMATQRGITMNRPLEVLEANPNPNPNPDPDPDPDPDPNLNPDQVLEASPTGNVELLLHTCAERYAAAGRPLQLVFCVIPDRGNSTYLYPAIKRWGPHGRALTLTLTQPHPRH